jgi:hypothetical protein
LLQEFARNNCQVVTFGMDGSVEKNQCGKKTPLESPSVVTQPVLRCNCSDLSACTEFDESTV